MESVLAQARLSPQRVSLRIEWHAVWIWTLCAGLVLYLGLDGGGYDLVVRSDAAVIVWWIVLVGAALGVLPVARISRGAWITLGLFGAFLAWSAISVTWSLSSEHGLEEVSRLAFYLGVLLLGLQTYGGRRGALRHVAASVATAAVAIAALALYSRLRPGSIGGAQTTITFLPGAHGRLVWPLNYWNALAALVAIGLPLLLAIATSARRLAIQALAAAGIPVVALCGYLTFSRGGAVAVAFGVGAFVALAPRRLEKLPTALIAGGGSAALIAGAVHRPSVERGLTDATARHQGATLMLAIVLVCIGVGIMQVGIGLATRHGTLPRALRFSRRRAGALTVVAVVAAAIVFVAAGGPHRMSHAWHQFKQPSAAGLGADALSRYGVISGNGRYTYWRTAVKAMPGHSLGGYGIGSFQDVWLPRAPFASYIRNAHSLYVETLTETGIIGLVLFGGFVVTVLVLGTRRVLRTQGETRTLVAAAVAATLAFAISAAADWTWQVPVLPIAVLLVVAGMLGPPTGRVRGSLSDRSGWPAGRWVLRVALGAVAIPCLVAIGIPLAETLALRRSQTAASTGDTAVALADARTASRIEPGAASPHLQEALVLELQGRVADALGPARQAAAEEPNNWQTWFLLARLEAESGNATAALTAYRQARAMNPHSLLFYVPGRHHG